MSAESVRELIVAYNNKGWGNKKWRSAEEMVRSIEETYYVEILPIQKAVVSFCPFCRIPRFETYFPTSETSVSLVVCTFARYFAKQSTKIKS